MTLGATDTDSPLQRVLEHLPAPSASMTQLLSMLAQENVQISDLASCIERDTILASRVLRLVNSASFGLRHSVTSVGHAVSLIGIARLRNFALGLSIAAQWNSVRLPRGWSQRRFNLHALAVAILSDQIALRVPAIFPEGAFVAGLLHDVGKLVLAVSYAAELGDDSPLVCQHGPALVAWERETFGVDHAMVSGQALARWKLPVEVELSVRHHHMPDQLPRGAARWDGRVSLADILAAADGFIHQVGYGLQPMEEPDWSTPLTLPGVELDSAEVIAEFQREMSAMEPLLA